MKTLSEIYYSHKNWLDDEEHPNVQTEKVIKTEMLEEADQYVKELTSIKDKWKNVLRYDVERLSPYDTIVKLCYNVPNPWKNYEGMSYDCNEGDLTDDEYRYLMHVELVETLFECVTDSIERYFNEYINLIEWAKNEDEEKINETQDTSDYNGQKEESIPGNDTQSEKQKTKKSNKGRKKSEDFRSYILESKKEDSDFLISVLKEEFTNGSQSPALLAKFIIAIITPHPNLEGNPTHQMPEEPSSNYWIEKPTHISVCREFGITKKSKKKDGTFHEESNSVYVETINRHYHYGDMGRYKNSKPIPQEELASIRNKISVKIEKLKAEKSKSK